MTDARHVVYDAKGFLLLWPLFLITGLSCAPKSPAPPPAPTYPIQRRDSNTPEAKRAKAAAKKFLSHFGIAGADKDISAWPEEFSIENELRSGHKVVFHDASRRIAMGMYHDGLVDKIVLAWDGDVGEWMLKGRDPSPNPKIKMADMPGYVTKLARDLGVPKEFKPIGFGCEYAGGRPTGAPTCGTAFANKAGERCATISIDLAEGRLYHFWMAPWDK